MEKVLCLITYVENEIEEEYLWLDREPYYKKFKEQITPLIDHLHNDIENGQLMPHYHSDTRYVNEGTLTRIYPHELNSNQIIDYRYLNKISDNFTGSTPLKFIKNSKLKHKCIYKGKCPHRGFDLSKIKPNENNIIKCPLHGLSFDGTTKKLIHSKM